MSSSSKPPLSSAASLSPRSKQGDATDAAPTAAAIKPHLLCSVCLQIYYKPVTLPCGHSTCQHCLLQIINATALKTSDESTCPECRAVFGLRVGNFYPATSLWNVVMALYPSVVADRAADCDFVYNRESAKLVGYEQGPLLKTPEPGTFSIDNLKNDRRLWRTISVPEEAQTMRSSLAFTTFPRHVYDKCRRIKVGVAKVTMEEDEYTEDGGFPILVRGDDEALIESQASGLVTVSLFCTESAMGENVPPPLPSKSSEKFICEKATSLSMGRAHVYLNSGRYDEGLPPGSYHVRVKSSESEVLAMTFQVRVKGSGSRDDALLVESDSNSDCSSQSGKDSLVMSSDVDEEDEEEMSGDDNGYDDDDGFVVADDVVEYASNVDEDELLDSADSSSEDSDAVSCESSNSDSDSSGKEDEGVLSRGKVRNREHGSKRVRDVDNGSSSARAAEGGGGSRSRSIKRRRIAIMLDDDDDEDEED